MSRQIFTPRQLDADERSRFVRDGESERRSGLSSGKPVVERGGSALYARPRYKDIERFRTQQADASFMYQTRFYAYIRSRLM